jgi:hypothetical protein
MLGKLIKVLHQVGSVGTGGSLAAALLLMDFIPGRPSADPAAVRQDIATLLQWLLMPSLTLVLISGLLAIAANGAYQNAGWAWVKALLGLAVFEGGFTVAGGARRAAELSTLAAGGQGDAAELARVLRAERGTLWLLLAVAVINILLAVWRPRLGRWPT